MTTTRKHTIKRLTGAQTAIEQAAWNLAERNGYDF